jgi:cellulose biosynthesis protein BcsQ/ABC-type multidrug transport system ATPase subunit
MPTDLLGRDYETFPAPEPLQTHGPARVIAMCNQKGGVGKTTSSINIGGALSQYGRRVLIVDFDPQGAATVGLGINANAVEDTVYTALFNPRMDVHSVIHHTDFENLDIMPANIDLSAAEVQLVTEVGREQVLAGVLRQVKDEYDVIIIDCQPSLGLLTVNALTAADGVIIPVAAEFFALRGVALLMQSIEKVQSRIKQLERLDRLEIEEEDLATLNIKFPPAPRSGQIVAEISEAGMSFGEKHVFSGANFVIEKGDRIALVGRNGEGKTTLARMLIGQLTPTEGSVRLGANVNIGYYAQNQDDLMDGDFTVYDTLDRVAVGDIRTRLRDILGAFLFRGEDIDKKVKVLSGGERARLAMARMMLEPRNLLVLDEPTNHMDMRSKDILKNAIMKYDGTVVVVSHDREFLDGMVEKVYEFRDGGVKEYLGGIYYFLEKRKLESLQEIERRDAPAKMPAKGDEPKPAVSGKLSYEQRKEQEKQLRKAKKVVETIEAELADIEKRIAEYDARFAAATEYNEADYKAYNELKTRYDHQMHEWEKASYELEIIENE